MISHFKTICKSFFIKNCSDLLIRSEQHKYSVKCGLFLYKCSQTVSRKPIIQTCILFRTHLYQRITHPIRGKMPFDVRSAHWTHSFQSSAGRCSTCTSESVLSVSKFGLFSEDVSSSCLHHTGKKNSCKFAKYMKTKANFLLPPLEKPVI